MALKKGEVESLPPVLVFLVRECAGYTPRNVWGSFDALGVRALQDIYFAKDASPRVLYAFTAEPPHGGDTLAVSLPLQIALESVFFHIAGVDELVLNSRECERGAAIPQRNLEFSVPSDFEAEVRIPREDLPYRIGAIAKKDERDLMRGAARALRNGAYFECYHFAHNKRCESPDSEAAWFYELFAYSFFGTADRALELYEQYPGRGSAAPAAQLLAARYRLLLKQFNEARTILHTLSFNQDYGALASSELARSYLIERQHARALDAANAAIQKDSDLIEGHLLRGIALRGLAYDAGEVPGLREAYADFERVAKQGVYGAAEALYHAGTVCARLGALAEAETALRQSLFQRDRVTARDALIRVLCARERGTEAAAELEVLEVLVPAHGEKLRADVGGALARSSAAPAADHTEVRESAELWSADVNQSVAAARALLSAWEIPLGHTPADCALLDDLINRFAPDGDFSREGRFSALSTAGHDVVARAFALHIGDLLVSLGGAAWSAANKEQCAVVSSRTGVEIPIEHFVKERVLLGASGDNFSSLESLVLELELVAPWHLRMPTPDWWDPVGAARQQEIEREVTWISETLAGFGVELSGSLSDLEVLDQWIEGAFEPGGTTQGDALATVAQQIDRFVTGLGVLVGQRIASVASGEWYDHEKPEGLSVCNRELGRIFPVARLQRRVYLASAADFSVKLNSLAWSVAVASVAGEVRSGLLSGHDDVRRALVERLPSIAAFPETELSGVVNSLLIGASLQSAER
jgi:tetratricopeptide (TPR) repeat protein